MNIIDYGKLSFPLKIYLGKKSYSVFHFDELDLNGLEVCSQIKEIKK